MKNSKLKLFLLGAALLLSVGAAAVFYESNKEQTITLGIYVDSSWNVPNSEGTKVIDYAIRRFEKENRGVKIKYESGLEKMTTWTGCLKRLSQTSHRTSSLCRQGSSTCWPQSGAWQNLTVI